MNKYLKYFLKLLVSSGMLTLILIFNGGTAHAEDPATQSNTLVIPDPAPSDAPATIVSLGAVQDKITTASNTIAESASINGQALIQTIQDNAKVDMPIAITIATTQEPISTAVMDASAKDQTAYQAIQTANLALETATASALNVSNQTIIVESAQSVVDSVTIDINNQAANLNNLTSAVDSQTATINLDTQNVNSATDSYNAANSAVSSNTTPGLAVTVYSDPQYAARPPVGAGTIVNQGYVSNVDFNWGSGRVMGGPNDRVQVHFTGQFTPNQTGTMWLTPQADDGTILNIGGISINNWVDKGGGGGTLTLPTTQGVPQTFDLWYYENGGGAFVQLLWYTGNGWQVVPASAFSQSTATAQQIAAVQSALNTLNSAQNTLSNDQNTLNTLQYNQNIAQQNLNNLNQNLINATSNLATEQQNLTNLQNIANTNLQIANALADTATATVKIASDAMANAVQVAKNYYAEQQRLAAEAAAKQAAQQAALARAAAEKAAADAIAAADKAAADKAAADKAAADAKAAADKAAADKAAADAKTSVTGVISNNPDQLSDTVVKEAPKEILVPHIQEDKAGVENGGIEFFGTKSAPQVVGEDGKLTPPAPPPGSGLPIPPNAITTQATFIGQPGGTTFNAPDIFVPVETITVSVPIPGAQALADAYVAVANIGADMSPVTRKKAKKILVVTAVMTQIAGLRRRFGQ